MTNDCSTLFFCLPSTTDRSESINQYMDHVSLHPIDCPYESFRQYSKTGDDFVSQDFELRDLEKRNKVVGIVQRLFKEAVEVSNSNLIRNVNNLILKLPPEYENGITWIGKTKKGSSLKNLSLTINFR